MSKSILERVFPKPRGSSLLPLTEPSLSRTDHQSTVFKPIELSSNISSRSSRRSSTHSTNTPLRSAPLSASIVHYDDPFLPIDRAASGLQQTIQSLLDVQAQTLSGRHASSIPSEPVDSPTKASSTTSLTQPMTTSGVLPIRQPNKKPPGLRSTRRSLTRSMQNFARLKNEELQFTQNEVTHRTQALQKLHDLHARQDAVQHTIDDLRNGQSNGSANSLQQEAATVQHEITALEDRLMELRAQHRYLVHRVEEVESVAASQLSGHEGALRMVTHDIKDFLKHPPVRQALSSRFDTIQQERADMYTLRPERRTLEMAQEQWSTELEQLHGHLNKTEREKEALLHGQEIWVEVVRRVEKFESQLADEMIMARSTGSNKDNTSVPSEALLHDLASTTRFLQRELATAEKKNYKLLIAAIGAELEAFKQAQQLLDPDEVHKVINPDTDDETTSSPVMSNSNDHATTYSDDNDVPSQDLLGPALHDHSQQAHEHDDTVLHHSVDSKDSNESLKDTLRSLSRQKDEQDQSRQPPASRDTGKHYESESEDEPGPEFLISH